ncbi:hypothetical protein M0R72_15185 [Candidatus Pacearchaeota archaeon]|nr:hypothetical protein [Candidatus Pacearchaeota archaeon]
MRPSEDRGDDGRREAIIMVQNASIPKRPYCFSLPERSARGRIDERSDDDCILCNHLVACQTAYESRPRILTLHLKEEYFRLIASGTKTEEYREATHYWRQRLQGKPFDAIEVCNAYPRRGDDNNRIWFRWTGCRIVLMKWDNGGILISGPTFVIPLKGRLEYPYQAMERRS